jgi:hypothetical protein
MTYARKTDGNQAVIIQALRLAGYNVYDASWCGRGHPDLIVSSGRHVWLVECKIPGAKLTPAEVLFASQHPVTVVYSPEDAVEKLNQLRYRIELEER